MASFLIMTVCLSIVVLANLAIPCKVELHVSTIYLSIYKAKQYSQVTHGVFSSFKSWFFVNYNWDGGPHSHNGLFQSNYTSWQK